MKAKHFVLFEQRSRTQMDTRFVVQLESWYAWAGEAKQRYLLFSGSQYRTQSYTWRFDNNVAIEVLTGNDEARHIRRAIQVYDDLTAGINDIQFPPDTQGGF